MRTLRLHVKGSCLKGVMNIEGISWTGSPTFVVDVFMTSISVPQCCYVQVG